MSEKNINVKLPTYTSDETKKFIKSVIRELNESKIITESMRGSLMVLAGTYDDFIIASNTVSIEGRWLQNYRGEMITHPALNTKLKAAATIQNYLKDFGLTPKSKAAMRGLKEDTQTALELWEEEND